LSRLHTAVDDDEPWRSHHRYARPADGCSVMGMPWRLPLLHSRRKGCARINDQHAADRALAEGVLRGAPLEYKSGQDVREGDLVRTRDGIAYTVLGSDDGRIVALRDIRGGDRDALPGDLEFLRRGFSMNEPLDAERVAAMQNLSAEPIGEDKAAPLDLEAVKAALDDAGNVVARVVAKADWADLHGLALIAELEAARRERDEARAEVAAVLEFCDRAEQIYRDAGFVVPGVKADAALISTDAVRNVSREAKAVS